MRIPEPRAGVLALALAAALAACSSPDPVLHTIAPVDGPVQRGGPKIVALQTVGLSRYLERPQIVRSSENSRLDISANDWWGEPLPAMLGRVLIRELGQRMPQSTVISEGGPVSAAPDVIIEIDIRQLDQDGSGNLVLQAQTNMSFKGKRPPVLRGFRIAQASPEPTIAGEIKAISAAVGQLADGIAATLAEVR